MFCLHEKDPLVALLSDVGVFTDTTATIIQFNMDELTPENYDFIQTSEI